jgi:hypothetical protein
MDIYRQIFELLNKHHSTCGHCCYDYPADCECGWEGSEDKDWAQHVGGLVGDLIIDLSGRGELLASIDRVARTTQR